MATESYSTMKASLVDDFAVSFALKRRIREDEERDPVDALADACALVVLAQARVDEAVHAARHGMGDSGGAS